MKQALFFFVFIFSVIPHIFAQYYTNQNKVWVFGNSAGVDFTSGSPVSISTSIFALEGTASVSDPSGNLLFYTNGKKVYNRTGAVMPSGSALVPFSTVSTTQAALIVPVIGSASRYYVFSLEDYSSSASYCHLAWSVVDMTLAGGLGDVVAATMGTPVEDSLGERMIAVPGNGTNIWLIVHRKDTTQFLAYEITASGVGAPVVSTVGAFAGFNNYVAGVIKCSPDYHKIACQGYGSVPGSTRKGLELFDFDPCTGIVSNGMVIDSSRGGYGAEFSPDNTKLYAQMAGVISQYDITLPSATAIAASEVPVVTGFGWRDLKLGPDSKIYFPSMSGLGYLDCISLPNLAGTACGYLFEAVSLLPHGGSSGMPNLFVTESAGGGAGVSTYVHHDTAACIPAGGSISIYPYDDASGYTWFDGATDSFHNISAAGTYWVREATGCYFIYDTINVTSLTDTIFTRQDTSVCIHSDSESCTITSPAGVSYIWYDGTTGATNTVHATGIYRVGYLVGCTFTVDTFHVTFNYLPNPIAGPDTICIGNTDTLSDAVTGGSWISNDTGVAIIDAVTGVVTGISAGTSTISYMLPTGCAQSKAVIVLGVPCATNVRKITGDNKIDVYPNPANDECVISWNGIISPGARALIYDITGRLMRTYPLTGHHSTISFTDLPQGMYHCRINVNGTATVSKKLVIIR